jgi:DNA-binding winged helix-turn-helix (wHTH) protein/TolB-like protein/Flp pilus assembly protein TadD
VAISKITNHLYEFGEFRMDIAQRLLLRDGQIVQMTPKAFDLLLVLVENNGKVVTKEELLQRVWPDSFVEEANLSHNVYKLREALGEKPTGKKYIETLARRGYRFVGTVNEILGEQDGVDLVLEEQTRASIVIEEEETPAPETSPATIPAVNVAELTYAANETKTRLMPALWVGACVTLIGVALVGYLLQRRHNIPPGGPREPIHSLAVLPFRPLSAESRDESLELGMADALITKLSNVKQIVVRPTSSILKYASSGQDLLSAGREQDVDAVIEGKVQKAGNQIRLTVQLVKVSDGASLWAGTFDDKFTNVFAVQDSISAQAAEALVSQLTPDAQKRIAKHYTDNIEAYQLYLQGRIYWYAFSPEGVEKSITYFNQAIALDPSYALAYAGLSFAYSVQGAIGAVAPAEAYPKSKQAAETALRLDDTLAEAHVAVGGKHLMYERDWSNAKREFERAIELNPNVADAHELLGYYWEVMEQYDRAAVELRNAQNIAPLMALTGTDIADLAYCEHRYDEAIDLYSKSHALDPEMVSDPFFPAQVYERKGEYERAIGECQKQLVSSPDNPVILCPLGYAYARSGRMSEAQAILNKFLETRKQHYLSPFLIALLCAGMDKKDAAFEWLNRALDERDPQMIWFHLDPQFEDLHSDPRYADLLRRMNIK